MIRRVWQVLRVVALVVGVTILAPVVLVAAVDRGLRYLADR